MARKPYRQDLNRFRQDALPPIEVIEEELVKNGAEMLEFLQVYRHWLDFWLEGPDRTTGTYRFIGGFNVPLKPGTDLSGYQLPANAELEVQEFTEEEIKTEILKRLATMIPMITGQQSLQFALIRQVLYRDKPGPKQTPGGIIVPS